MQRLGLEPGTFRLQTVGSTAAPGPPFIYRAGMQKKKRMVSLLYSVDALLCILSTKSWLQTLAKEGIVRDSESAALLGSQLGISLQKLLLDGLL